MAEAADVANLARKLRGKGLTDDQVRESLTGLGYSKTQAGQAVAAIGPTAAAASPAAKKAQPKGARRTSPARKTGAPAPTAEVAPPPAAGSSGAGGGTGLSMPKIDLPSPTLTPPRRLGGGDLGGFFAGLLLYTLALNYLRYGSEGVSGWLRAKFLNQPAAIAAVPTGRIRRAEDTGLGPVGDTRLTVRPQRPKEV